MLTKLHYPRNRPYLRFLVCILLLCWLPMIVSATCAMPMASLTVFSDPMPAGCSDANNHTHTATTGNPGLPSQNCSLKPCLDTPPNPVFELKADNPELPVFILSLVGLSLTFFEFIPKLRLLRTNTSPPIGRRILLIYRYCTLLN